MIADGHAHARVVCVIFPRPVNDHAIDHEHPACGHGHGQGLCEYVACPGRVVNGHVDAGEVVRAGHDAGATIFNRGFFEVKNDRKNIARPLLDIAVQGIALVFPRGSQGRVIVAVGEDFDIRPQKRFERVERERMRGGFSENRRAVHQRGNTHGPPILVADKGFDFAVEIGHNRGLQVFDQVRGQPVRQAQKSVVPKELDLSHREHGTISEPGWDRDAGDRYRPFHREREVSPDRL